MMELRSIFQLGDETQYWEMSYVGTETVICNIYCYQSLETLSKNNRLI